jgi:hypothetical protein
MIPTRIATKPIATWCDAIIEGAIDAAGVNGSVNKRGVDTSEASDADGDADSDDDSCFMDVLILINSCGAGIKEGATPESKSAFVGADT